MATSAGQRDYHLLFSASVLGLVATGLATVGLALLAYELSGDDAGAVLGTALALKMAVNVVVPSLVPAIAIPLPRKSRLIMLIAARAAILAFLPFADEPWHLYLLVVVFETAAASFRATYVATVPDMVREDAAYAAALAKTRIAGKIESVLSPLLAAALLTVSDVRSVFAAAAALFLLAGLILIASRVPDRHSSPGASISRLTRGFRTIVSSRTLRGALALNAAAVAISAMVVVNTVVLVVGAFGEDDTAAAVALAAFAAGGIGAAAAAPVLIRRFGERAVMLGAGAAMSGLLVSGLWLNGFPVLIVLWIFLGATVMLAELPVEALLRRAGALADRESIYASRYAIDSGFLMLGYAAAGWVGAELGLTSAFLVLASFAFAMVATAALWMNCDQPSERRGDDA